MYLAVEPIEVKVLVYCKIEKWPFRKKETRRKKFTHCQYYFRWKVRGLGDFGDVGEFNTLPTMHVKGFHTFQTDRIAAVSLVEIPTLSENFITIFILCDHLELQDSMRKFNRSFTVILPMVIFWLSCFSLQLFISSHFTINKWICFLSDHRYKIQ